MKNSSNVFQPKTASQANAAQLRVQPGTQAASITDNRPTAIRQRKIQEASQRMMEQKPSLIQTSLAGQGASVVQRVIHKGKTIKSASIGLKASDFYKDLPSDNHRQWAIILHGEKEDYTKETALAEIEDRITKKLPIPAVDGHEDPQMRQLIEQHQSGPGKSRKQDRQVDGMHGLYENGTQTEKDQMIAHLKQPANAKGFTEAVRQGELNETLLTSDTRDAALRSLGANVGVKTHAETTTGKKVYWTDYQSDTSYQTRYFTFPDTTTDADGNEIQDTHINGSTYREDSDGDKHLTVGSTSQEYHFGADESLAANFSQSTSVVSFARRNAKFHRKSLATREEILATDASGRAEQMYRTTNGTVLNLNDEEHLEIYAEHVQIHTQKVNTALFRQARRFKVDGNESESDVSDIDSEDQVEMHVDTDDEAEDRIEKRKNASKGSKKVKKVKIIY